MSRDNRAMKIIRQYVKDYVLEEGSTTEFEVFISYKCRMLQNTKYFLETSLEDGNLFSLSYEESTHLWYFDIYNKFNSMKICE